jgi:hypothetical protein
MDTAGSGSCQVARYGVRGIEITVLVIFAFSYEYQRGKNMADSLSKLLSKH